MRGPLHLLPTVFLAALLALPAAPLSAQTPDMREVLRGIAAEAPDSVYQGTPAIRRHRQRLERLDGRTELPEPAERALVLLQLGNAELRYGREEEAIQHLEESLALVPESTAERLRTRVLFALGVANLRLAETRNCCALNTADSCILPLRGGAVHTRREGSTAAADCFRRLLALLPEDATQRPLALWLLNLAAMTLGEYPDGVPAELRIDPERLGSSRAFPEFRNVSGELGLDTFSLAGGVVVDDLDGDGDFDILSAAHDVTAEMRLFRNEADGTFTEHHAAAGLSGITGGLNLVHADYDDDGDLDVLVLRGAWLRTAGRHPNSLLRNDGVDAGGELRFTDVTFAVGLGEPHHPTQTAAWADYDGDGDLDLFVGNETTHDVDAPCQLFRNDPAPAESGDQGGRVFVDVASSAGVENGRFTKGVAWGDYDDDGDPDLFVSNYGGENRLYRNQGDGSFQDVAGELGVAGPVSSFPAWFWDYDNDGALDLFVSYYAPEPTEIAAWLAGAPARPETTCGFYRNRGDGTFENVARAVGLDRPMMPMGCNFGDLDNDGWLDFYLGTGSPDFASVMPNLMFRSERGERFSDVTLAGRFGHLQKGHAIAFADLDGDGDQDIFEEMGGAFEGDRYQDALFENPGFGNHWLSVKLVGTKSNRCAIGARLAVTVEADGSERTVRRRVGPGASFGASPLEQHVGLGAAERIVRLEVDWPTSGIQQVFDEVPLDRRIVITEGTPGLAVRD